jgi:Ca2+-binding RTX toxin-like protein
VIYGGADADVLSGQTGDDILYGGSGNDHLDGNEHNDRLCGEAGIDHLDGGSGANTLSGGADRDTYILYNDGTPDKILDFDNGLDRFHIDASTFDGSASFTFFEVWSYPTFYGGSALFWPNVPVFEYVSTTGELWYLGDEYYDGAEVIAYLPKNMSWSPATIDTSDFYFI